MSINIDLVQFMINEIALNKDKYIGKGKSVNWDDIAAAVWNKYPGIINEFMINDSIDLILEAAEGDY